MPGIQFRQVIESVIPQVDLIVILLSKKALQRSVFFHREVGLALDKFQEMTLLQPEEQL